MTREEIAKYRRAFMFAARAIEFAAIEIEEGTKPLDDLLEAVQTLQTVAASCEREITKETK